MDEMSRWLNKQLDEKLCEPNSDLATAIAYMLNHWEPLTLFLRFPGAPLDSSIVERALKKACCIGEIVSSTKPKVVHASAICT
jgi:hypothetical protein